MVFRFSNGKEAKIFVNIPLIALLLQGIPEQTAVVTLAFVIARIPLRWKIIFPIGIGLSTCAYLLRLLPITFGIHTILLIILLFIALTRQSNADFSQSLIASLLSFLVLIIFEFISISSLMFVLGITPETIFSDTVLRILSGEPQVLLTFVMAFLLNKIFINKEV